MSVSFRRREGGIELELPGEELGGVRAAACVVGGDAFFQIVAEPNIRLRRMGKTADPGWKNATSTGKTARSWRKSRKACPGRKREKKNADPLREISPEPE